MTNMTNCDSDFGIVNIIAAEAERLNGVQITPSLHYINEYQLVNTVVEQIREQKHGSKIKI